MLWRDFRGGGARYCSHTLRGRCSCAYRSLIIGGMEVGGKLRHNARPSKDGTQRRASTHCYSDVVVGGPLCSDEMALSAKDMSPFLYVCSVVQGGQKQKMMHTAGTNYATNVQTSATSRRQMGTYSAEKEGNYNSMRIDTVGERERVKKVRAREDADGGGAR